MAQDDRNQFIVNYMAEIWHELSTYLMQHPGKLAQYQSHYWQSYLNFCQEFANPENKPEADVAPDKRFKHADWQNNIAFNFIQRSYQFVSEQSEHLTTEFNSDDAAINNKLRFFSRQFIDSMAPTNFINTNPEILAQTMATNGANLVEGFKQFREDLERGSGMLEMPITDTSKYEIGNNIACTPGKIVYQNDLMQLIQYLPTTDTVYEYPLLITPPWINKYYILDLQPHNSLVKWLVDQGHTVFLISWVNPTGEHKHKEFSNYMTEGPLAALDVIKSITVSEKVNLLGYCIGGTLQGCLLAYLAKINKDTQIASATFLTTLLDFTEPGELATFIDEKQISMLETHMFKHGYLDGRIMGSVFNALKANDLIWSAFIRNYLKGQRPEPFDLLYWNADSTNIPAPAHSFYLRQFYLENNLIKPDAIVMNQVSLNLNHIKTPVYFLATCDDHIVPWQAAYKSCQYLQTSTKFVLAGSGHVAGVINPPQNTKYGYWTNDTQPMQAADFLETATLHKGSWWNDWREWVKQHSEKTTAALKFQVQLNKIKKNAPGAYVKVRLDNEG